MLTPRHVLCALLAFAALLPAQTQVRVAYNIKFLNKDIPAARKASLRSVIDNLDADIIALQEIKDRAALEVVFSPQEWVLVIDDDSGDDQDVALAVRRPWSIEGMVDLDADDEHFLFPGSANNSSFPLRRDVLALSVRTPSGDAAFTVMVVHAKARVGGRPQTDPRRVTHSLALVDLIRDRFDDTPFVILGDWNDNPDDQSMNVLETGHADAPGGPENVDGPLMINLAEVLLAEDRVSHGLNSAAIFGDQIDTVDPGSRARNNDLRGTDAHTGGRMVPPIMTLDGPSLRKRRKLERLSQVKVGKYLGISQSQLSVFERGGALPRRAIVVASGAPPWLKEVFAGELAVEEREPCRLAFCSAWDCVSNLPIGGDGKVVFVPMLRRADAPYCGWCGEPLVYECENPACAAIPQMGAACMRCGEPYVPCPDTTPSAEWIAARLNVYWRLMKAD